MEQLDRKIDSVLCMLRELRLEIIAMKEDTRKMSSHIDSVEVYVQMFENRFQTRKLINETPQLEIAELD